MPVQGFVRLRKHQFGRQAAWGNAEPGVRAYPFRGVPSVVRNWTDPDIDSGSLFPVAAPILGEQDVTASLTAPVANYNDLPLVMSALWGGGETATGAGTAKTRVWTPTATSADAFDLWTYEFGDDVTTDWYQLTEGILTQAVLNAPAKTDPVDLSMSWMFANWASTGATDYPVDGTVPSTGLSVATDDVPLYCKDFSLYIDSTAGTIGTTLITGALHSFRQTFTVNVDKKYFLDGAGDMAINEYGRASMLVETELTFAKTSDTVGTGSESDAWMSETAVDRFIRLSATSNSVAETGTPDVPYSFIQDMPARYYTREDGELGGNSIITLMARSFYEPVTLDYAYEATLVNTLADTEIES